MNNVKRYIVAGLILVSSFSSAWSQESVCKEELKRKTKAILSQEDVGKGVTYVKMTTSTVSSNSRLPDGHETVEYLYNKEAMVMLSKHVDMMIDKQHVISVFHDDRLIIETASAPDDRNLMQVSDLGRDSIIDAGILSGCDCIERKFKECSISVELSKDWSERLSVEKVIMAFNKKGEFLSYTYVYAKGSSFKTVAMTIEEFNENIPYKGDFSAQGYLRANKAKYMHYEKN